MTLIHARMMEATTGFEPVNRGFADLRLTHDTLTRHTHKAARFCYGLLRVLLQEALSHDS